MVKRSIIAALSLLVVILLGSGLYISFNQGSKPTDNLNTQTPKINRSSKIPSNAVKITPDNDSFRPSLHTGIFEKPVQLPRTIDTAGAEDSPFITLDGKTLYFFFTPDPSVPAEKQLFDNVTGIWRSMKTDEKWSEAEYVNLTTGDLHLDGAATVASDELWFASARKDNYRSIDIWIADLVDGKPVNIRNAGERLNNGIGVGELHISVAGDEIYFHAIREGGKGGMDIWVTRLVGESWSDPVNIADVNTPENDGFPYLSEDGNELWFTRPSYGYPAIWMSRRINDGWSEPRLMVSNFAAEPTLDAEGNLYFCHHFIKDGVMLEADIYYAERIREPLKPIDSAIVPERGYLMGFLPMPAMGGKLEDAYKLANASSDFVPVWGRPTPYYLLASDLSGDWGKLFLSNMVRDAGLVPVININFMGPNLTLDAPKDIAWVTLNSPFWRSSYREAVLDVVREFRPRYMSIGNEVNRWFEKYGLEGDYGFRHYVTLYEEIYDAVKELSPETKVFCSFAREIVSEQRVANMSVLGLFNPSKLDLLAFTSYPYTVKEVNSPDDLPEDYYTNALIYLPDKPMSFTELGWSSHPFFGGENGQADFLQQVVGRLSKGADLEFIGWCWLSDLSESDTVGLFSYLGVEKKAWGIWQGLFASS